MAYYVVKQMVDAHGRSRYFIVKTYSTDSRVLWATNVEMLPLPPSCYVLPLERLLDPDCVDREFELHTGTFLEEWEFKNLMERHIRKCHSNAEEKLEELKDFIYRAKEKYPIVVKTSPLNPNLDKLLPSHATVLELAKGAVHLYLHRGELVAHLTLLDLAVILPYDPNSVDPRAVRELDDTTAELLKEALQEPLPSLAPEHKTLLEKAEEVISYTIMLYEMLRNP